MNAFALNDPSPLIGSPRDNPLDLSLVSPPLSRIETFARLIYSQRENCVCRLKAGPRAFSISGAVLFAGPERSKATMVWNLAGLGTSQLEILLEILQTRKTLLDKEHFWKT